MNYTPAPQMQTPPAAAPGTSGFSVTALVTGIVGMFLSWVPIVGLVFGVVSTTFGSLGWWQAKSRGKGGFGMAIAGFVLGILTIIVAVIVIVALASTP